MTHEEAIEKLKILKEDYWDDDGYGHESKLYDDTTLALKMAIKALEERKTFPKFEVIDNKTGKEPDLEDIVLNEEWAYSSNLIHCDMEGFAITNNGDLIMLDECGNYEFCPEGRFTVVMGGEEE